MTRLTYTIPARTVTRSRRSFDQSQGRRSRGRLVRHPAPHELAQILARNVGYYRDVPRTRRRHHRRDSAAPLVVDAVVGTAPTLIEGVGAGRRPLELQTPRPEESAAVVADPHPRDPIQLRGVEGGPHGAADPDVVSFPGNLS